ncbi:MAG: ExbD/TolR family protein [Bradymonadaceae bacterium]
MNFRNTANSRRAETTLELTPLIDVVFLLLIFFLITTTFVQTTEAEIPINLPEAASGVASEQVERMVLVVTATGGVAIEGEGEVSSANLRARLEELHEQNPMASILLKGDVEATHGKVIELLDVVKQTGFSRVNLVIQQSAPSQP